MSKRGSGSSTRASSGFVDHSRYAKQHNDIVSFVKKQVGVDLNKYRDGDGSSPSTSSFWEKDGAKVTILKESDFKKEDAANKANQDYINKHQIDYSLGYGLGPGFSIDKAARKRARMSRLANRRRK